MKRIKHLVVSLFLLFFVCLIFLFATESGLVVIQKSVNRFGGGGITISQVDGKLLGDMVLNGIGIVTADADIEIKQLDYSWRPGSIFNAKLNIPKLVVTGVDITLKDNPESAPASDAIELPATLLPITVLFKSLVLNRLAIVDSDGDELFIIDKMMASLESNAERLTISEFDLQGPEIGLTLHGNIEFQRGWALELLGNWRLAGFEFHPMVGTFSATGPLGDPHLEVGIHSPASIRVEADLVDLLGNPEWTARLEAKDVDLSNLIIDCPKIELASVAADLSGDFDHYRGRVQADGAWGALEGMHLVTNLDGDFLGIDFQLLRIDKEDSSVEVRDGKIDWKDIFSWDGRFLFKNFDASTIVEELQGRFTADLVSAGDVKENGVVASFKIVTLEGVFQDIKVVANGNVFLTETDVQTDGLTIRSGDVAGLAHLEQGMFSWAEEPHWSGKIRLDQFDPSWLYPDLFGSVSGEVKGEGRLGNLGLEASVNIENLSGTLRGNEISGGGEITLSGNTLQSTGLVLKSGLSELVVNGHAGDNLALDFSLSSPDVGAILPESKGSLAVKGSLRGTRHEPQINVKIEGAELVYQENNLDRAQAEIQAGLKTGGRLSGSLEIEKMRVSGVVIDKSNIELKGTLAEHELVVGSAGSMGELSFRARGGYRDDWQGELSHLQLRAADFGDWRQEESVKVKAGREEVLLEKLCLTDGESSACLGADVQLKKELLWAVHTELTSVPLKWLNRLKLTTVPVNGKINATVAANGNSHSIIAARVESRVPAASLSMNVDDDEPVPFYFDESVLTLDLTDARLQGNVNIRMQNDSQVILSVNVEGAGDFSAPLDSLALEGSLALKEFDLALLAAFTGYGVEPSGLVNNSFTISGTVGQPKIYGDIIIKNGGVELPYQGITLGDIVLSIEAGEDAAKVSGKATSGPGQVTAVGTVRYGMDGIEGVLNITGDDFLLVNLPEYTIRVEPDLVLTLSNDTGEISGTIDVPYGLIAPEEMSDSISVSEDVVIVSGTEEEQTNSLPIKPSIKVRLGDDVRVDGYGVTGRLEGELDIITTKDNSLAGRGKLNLVDGTFAMYGQKLTIARGRMLFTGGPLDNPGIDVRAQRKVNDRDSRGDSYTVGIDISGFVQDLQYNLFSDPFMEDTDILSYMIVGQAMANSTEEEGGMLEAAAMMLGTKGSSGFAQDFRSLMQLDDLRLEGSGTREEMALVVGKRLTEDLYIGYDLNMFSQLSQFRVRYDLKRGFYVETRSSAESTGTDLIYSFER